MPRYLSPPGIFIKQIDKEIKPDGRYFGGANSACRRGDF
jgi:hypothetical protein